jgi:hypothetical protein
MNVILIGELKRSTFHMYEYTRIVWKIPPKWYAVIGIRGRERINTAVLCTNVWNVDLCSLYQA